MPSHTTSQSDYVFARSRRTGETEIRRADEFTPHPRTSLPPQARTLHYIGADRTRVCRCSTPSRHYEKTFNVASDSTHLNASLTLYMSRHHIDSCTVSDFQKYRERRKAQWAKGGVSVENFHYVSRDKDVVCRCAEYGHGYSEPRNSEIVEQCAEYFCLHQGILTISKDQWKGIDGDSPPAYSSGLPRVSGYTAAGPAYSPETLSDAFQYDSKSKQDLLKSRSKQQDRSRESPEMQIRNSAERVAPTDRPYRTVVVAPRQSEPEMPSQVWRNARPSVCVPGYGTHSAMSTPLGSAFPATPVVPPATPAKIPQSYRPSPLSMWQPSGRSSSATYWSNIQREAGVSDEETTPDMPRAHQTIGELPGSTSPWASLAEATMGVPKYHELDANTIAVFEKDGEQPPVATPIAELPAHQSTAELPAQIFRHRDTTTLKNLEGRDWDTASEIEAQGQRPSIRVVRVEKPATRRNSTSTSNSDRLSSLFDQVLDIAGSSLPNQEEFLLRHAVLSSRANPAPAGNCELCREPYQHGRKRTVMLLTCGHVLHKQFLLDSLRALDQQFGKCSICQLTLCERTLADRIDTDRKAIFGSQLTPLRDKVHIEFPQRSEMVKCVSEEQVAIVLLRLMKDYVDIHAEELFRLWKANRVVPDWFAGVVKPVVKLFQGWWTPTVRSRFFADHEAFLKLLAWAELVRLMNTSRVTLKRTQGEDALFPQLGELHGKFTWSINRCNLEKKNWQTNRSGILDCEKIATDVVELASFAHSLDANTLVVGA
jgi:hypothetical protein